MRLSLGEDDRERLGVDEWLECDLSHLSTEEAEALEEATGLEYHVVAGTSARSVRAKVWLALYRAGKDPEWDKMRFDLSQLRTEVPRSGKASSAPAGSPTSTTSSSSTRGRRNAPSGPPA